MGRREDAFRLFNDMKEETLDRVNSGIEANRKGYFKITVKDKDGNAIPGVKVRAKLKKHEFKYGANIFMLDELESDKKNEAYKKAFVEAFNQATLPFYWSDLEPVEGKPRFSSDSPKVYRRPAPDLALDFCEKNGIYPKAHCLTYFNFTPDWVDINDIDDQKKRLTKRYKEIAERYSDRIKAWEVINELLCTQYPWNKNPFFCSDDVLEWNFKLAEKYFPNNELILNEAGIAIWEGIHYAFNRSAYYQMIERALKSGSRIDTVGMQFHVFADRNGEKNLGNFYYNPKRIFEVLDTYEKLHRPIQITEITVPAYSNDPEDEAIQADLIEMLYSIWFSHKAVEMITYWNVVDGYAAWAPQGDMTKGENVFFGGLMRFDMSKKPSYDRIKSLFSEKWVTDTEGETNAAGTAKIKGFYGDYDILIDGKTYKAENLSGRRNETEIILK